MYIYEQKDWPNFRWSQEKLGILITEVRYLQGNLLGRMGSLEIASKEEATLQTLTSDVVKTSAIEGEVLDADQVRSSLARKLGIEVKTPKPIDKSVEGIVEVLLDATLRYSRELTAKRLFDWHAALFPTGRSGMQHINVGQWRNEASGDMEIVSGALRKGKGAL